MAVISKSYQILFIVTFLIFVIGFIINNWNDPDSINVKLGTVFSIGGTYVMAYVALWTYTVERDKKKEAMKRKKQSQEENTYYKTNLIYNFQSLVFLISETYKPKWNMPFDDEGRKILYSQIANLIPQIRSVILETCNDLQIINLNPYVPAYVKDLVGRSILYTKKIFPAQLNLENIPNYRDMAKQVLDNIETLRNDEYLKEFKDTIF